MLRRGTLVVAGLLAAWLLAAGPAVAQEAKSVKLRWYGMSFFQLETTAGTKVVIDPHAIEAFGRPEVSADLILLSHLHEDHTRLEAVMGADKAKVIRGMSGNLRKHDWVDVDETFKDVKVRSVKSYHDDSEGMERGKNTIFVIEADGLKFCHLGDLGHELTPAQIKAIGPIDVLLIPVGGVYTLNGDEAKTVYKQLKPRLYAIPMHCGTRFYGELLPPDEFLDGFKNVKKMDTNEVSIPLDAKATDREIILLKTQK
jgi:L-ascorbate metabolism protein UlaG (beta-lactamase superfamily)